MILAQSTQPFFEPEWVLANLDDVLRQFGQHVWLTGLALVTGLAISLPLGIYAHRHRWSYGPVTWITGILYTIPSLALFAFLVPYTGLTTLTAEIGLVGYTLLILIRNTVSGLDQVPADIKQAAAAMGFSDRQMLFKVELPLALPIIVAGIRIAAVTTIGLVTVTALIGQGGLGHFILIGLRRFFSTPIVLGAGLSVALALTADGLLLWMQRVLMPWSKTRAAKTAA